MDTLKENSQPETACPDVGFYGRCLLVTADFLFATKRFLHSLAAAVDALGAGLIHPYYVRKGVGEHWGKTTWYMTEDHINAGFFQWEIPAYDRHLPKHGNVGIIGCGAGRDVIAFARRAYEVVGIDISAKCIAKAKTHLSGQDLKAEVHCADACIYRFADRPYSAFTFSWFTYTFLPDANARTALLRRLSQQLADEGVIFVSLPMTKPVWKWQFLARAANRLVPGPWRANRDDFFAPGMFGGNELHYQVAMDPEMLTREARTAGMTVVGAYTDSGEGSMFVLAPFSDQISQ